MRQRRRQTLHVWVTHPSPPIQPCCSSPLLTWPILNPCISTLSPGSSIFSFCPSTIPRNPKSQSNGKILKGEGWFPIPGRGVLPVLLQVGICRLTGWVYNFTILRKQGQGTPLPKLPLSAPPGSQKIDGTRNNDLLIVISSVSGLRTFSKNSKTHSRKIQKILYI